MKKVCVGVSCSVLGLVNINQQLCWFIRVVSLVGEHLHHQHACVFVTTGTTKNPENACCFLVLKKFSFNVESSPSIQMCSGVAQMDLLTGFPGI